MTVSTCLVGQMGHFGSATERGAPQYFNDSVAS